MLNYVSAGHAEVLPRKFEDPFVTAEGLERASVELDQPETLWFNTGTLCNITCENCFIESSPRNDRLVYLSADEVEDYLFQLKERRWPVAELGFTGGEPFLNPEFVEILRRSVARSFDVLVLTNAMRPMMRPRVQEGLLELQSEHPGKITFRVSLDHYSEELHDAVRGHGAFKKSLVGMDWLRDNGFTMAAAGRTIWSETEHEARSGYANLFASRNYKIEANDPRSMVLFPEITPTTNTPEISTGCWKMLGKRPQDMMCSTSRMVVKRKGAAKPVVVACTLIPYDPEFEFGSNLEDSEQPVYLNHPSCSQFCVLGGASCSPRNHP